MYLPPLRHALFTTALHYQSLSLVLHFLCGCGLDDFTFRIRAFVFVYFAVVDEVFENDVALRTHSMYLEGKHPGLSLRRAR